jgi:hypothetical protein
MEAGLQDGRDVASGRVFARSESDDKLNLPDGQNTHAHHARFARRANLPQLRSIARNPKSVALRLVPRSIRGAYRDRHGRWMRDAMDAMAHETNATVADGEGVWSWRPLAGAKSADDDQRTTVTEKSWTPGRARRKPLKPIARGMPV